MTAEAYELPAPAAWVDGLALRWLANPELGPHAYIETTLNTENPAGVRTALYTADQVRAAIQQERERCARLCESFVVSQETAEGQLLKPHRGPFNHDGQMYAAAIRAG
jgi:hypothetical protein